MENIIYFIKSTTLLFLSALEFAFLLRAILSWFMDEENKILFFLIAVTEPVITPVRALFDKFGWGMSIPIDLPFIVTYILISLIGVLLSMW